MVVMLLIKHNFNDYVCIAACNYFLTIHIIVYMHIYIYLAESLTEQDTKKHVSISLTRKAVQDAFWNDEIHSEITESQMDFKFFKPEDR